MKRCFLFGHRNTPCHIQAAIESAVERYYMQHSVRQFIVGDYGRFDIMAGAAVKAAKRRHNDICIKLLLPYHPSERAVEAPEGFDGTLFPSIENTPRRYAIVKANRYMIENSDFVICYVKYPGNSSALLKYARRRKIIINNLGEQTQE